MKKDGEIKKYLMVTMYKKSDDFPEVDNDAIIWKYMDIWKFLDMLRSETLWFSKLLLFQDKLEGTLSDKSRKKCVEELNIGLTGVKTIENKHRNVVHVSSFYKKPIESNLMWRQYGGEYGIAIKLKAGNIKNAVLDERDVYMANVCYLDYCNDLTPFDSLLQAGIQKSNCYEDEHEVRCLVLDGSNNKPGIKIKMDMAKFIDAIYISPYAPSYAIKVVKDVCSNYGLTVVTVLMSSINRVEENL